MQPIFYPPVQAPTGFDAYKLYLAGRARSEGIGDATIRSTVPYLTLNARAIELDRAQRPAPRVAGSAYMAPFAPYRREHVTPSLINVCGIDRPRTGLEGKFSLRAATALTLLGESTADLNQYTDTRLQAPDLVGMIDRVTVVGDANQPPSTTTVTVTSTSGQTHQVSYDSSIRRHDLTQEWDALSAKFHTLVDGRLGVATANEIISAVAALDERADHGYPWPSAAPPAPSRS
jgi:hypothetical protein